RACRRPEAAAPRCPSLRSAPPKVLEPVRRHLGVLDSVLDVLVPEVVLQSPCVVAIIGELKTTGMAQLSSYQSYWLPPPHPAHRQGCQDAFPDPPTHRS